MQAIQRYEIARVLLLTTAAFLFGCSQNGPEVNQVGPTATDAALPGPNETEFDMVEPEILATTQLDAIVEGKITTIRIDVPQVFPESMPRGPARLGLLLDDIEFGRPGVYFDVYAMLPEGVEPDPAGQYYIGTLSTFGPQGQESHASYDVTTLVEKLMREKRWTGDLELIFVRRGLESPTDQPELEMTSESTDPVRIGQARLVRY